MLALNVADPPQLLKYISASHLPWLDGTLLTQIQDKDLSLNQHKGKKALSWIQVHAKVGGSSGLGA